MIDGRELPTGRLVAAALLVVFLLGIGAGHWWSEPSIFLGLLQVVFALAAFVAAAIAAWAIWPQFREWQRERLRRPDIKIWLEVAHDEHSIPHVVGDDRRIVVGAAQGTVVVKAAISNGTFEQPGEREKIGTLHNATLNIVVPLPLDLRTLDPPGKTHYRAVLPSANDGTLSQWYGGAPTPAVFTAARGDLGPGHHVFHVEVMLPDGPGPWPIKVVLDGDPEPPPEAEILAEIHREVQDPET